jgi:hypothetical protein
MPIFLKGNHQLESRMQEICQSGSEGGAKLIFVPTPISAQALAGVALFLRASPRKEHGGSIEEVRSEGAICSGSNWGELITHLTGRGSESI